MSTARCYHFLNEKSGEITTPNYPRNYPANFTCIWTVTAPPGYYVQLTFKDFDVEPYEDCQTDFLEIKDGGNKNSPLIGIFLLINNLSITLFLIRTIFQEHEPEN